MPRRRVVSKRTIIPDPVYSSQLLARFINQIMISGKKSLAERVVYGALNVVKEKTNLDPLAVFEKAIENIRPSVEVKSRRVGGATYQVPVEIKASRAITLAMRWLVDFSRKRGEKGIMLKLAGEILDAADIIEGSSDEDDESVKSSSGIRSGTGKGAAVKKKEETHRIADTNKAFSHYRW